MRGLGSLLWVGVWSGLLAACGGHSKSFGEPDAASGSGGSRTFGDSAGTLASSYGGDAPASGGSGKGGAPGAGGNGRAGAQTFGGSATGGTASSASGGAGMPSNLPEAPANCQAKNQAVTNESCSYSFECGPIPFYSRCDLGDSGAWACSCATKTGGAVIDELMFHDADATTVCGTMARACMTEAPAGQRLCERTSVKLTNSECVIDESCGPSFELGAGVTAHGVERHSVRCRPNGDGGFSCACQPQIFGKQDHTIGAPSLKAACEAMVDVCRDGIAASAGPPTCTDTQQPPAAGACGVSRTCTREAALGNGVTLTSAMTRHASCASGDDGRSGCECTGDQLASFDLQAELGTGTSPCNAMLEACTGVTKLEAIGAVDCKILGKHEQAQTCDAKLTCSRPLKVGATEATGRGQLNLACQQHDPGGPWWCACVSKGAPKIFELGSAPTAVDACDAAMDRCPQEVEIEFGPHAPLQMLPTLF